MTIAQFWYRIVDSVGEPYHGTNVLEVGLSQASTNIVTFRRAVKQDNDNLLGEFSASQLAIFKNISAFQRKDELGADAIIDGLGKIIEEAFLVLVPPSIPKPVINRVQYYSPCQIPFYNHVMGAAEREGWVQFDQVIPYTTGMTKLYIRECFKSMVNILQPSDTYKFLITGTSGSGVTFYLFYLLWKLVQEGKRVVFVYHPDIIYYDGHGGVYELSQFPPYQDFSFWRIGDLWCLFDAKEKLMRSLDEYYLKNVCPFVAATTPGRLSIRRYLKRSIVDTFIIPLWTEEEMNAISSCFPDVVDWRQRFHILGGVPRFVMEWSKVDPIELLEAACRDHSLLECLTCTFSIFGMSQNVEPLVHLTSEYPYTDEFVGEAFASNEALNVLVRVKGAEATMKRRQLMDQTNRNLLAVALRRRIS